MQHSFFTLNLHCKMLWVCSSRPLELRFVRAWDCSQQNAATLANQHVDCKVHVNYQRISHPIRWKFSGKWKRGPSTAMNITMTRNQTAAMISFHSKDYDYPHRLDCCISLYAGSHLALQCMFAHFRSPCHQCHDSIAGPNVGWSAACFKFLLYHSNFVIPHFQLKARQNCRRHLVRLFPLVTKSSHHLHTAQLHTDDCVLLP